MLGSVVLGSERNMDVVEAWERQRSSETLENYLVKIEEELVACLPPKRNTRTTPTSKVYLS